MLRLALVVLCVSVDVVGAAPVASVEIERGEHKLRRRSDCTVQELRANRAYMTQRGLWKDDVVFWEDRTPPTNCKFAGVVGNLAFFPVPGSVAPMVPDRLQHKGVAYFFNDDKVLVSGMCGPTPWDFYMPNSVKEVTQMYCDVPNNKDPEETRHDITQQMKQDGILVTLCGQWVTTQQFREHWGFDVEHNDRFECGLMWDAEQSAYNKFEWKKAWEPFKHDCQHYLTDVLTLTKAPKELDLTM